MARFQFKYEAVLKQRQAAEDQAQRELARHLRHRGILRDRLARMQQDVREAKQQLGDGLVGRVDLERIRDFARYSGQVTLEAQQAVGELARIEQRIATARHTLTEAMRRRKAIQTLRDKHYRRWLAEQRRKETIELDEMAAQRYARRLSGAVQAEMETQA